MIIIMMVVIMMMMITINIVFYNNFYKVKVLLGNNHLILIFTLDYDDSIRFPVTGEPILCWASLQNTLEVLLTWV